MPDPASILPAPAPPPTAPAQNSNPALVLVSGLILGALLLVGGEFAYRHFHGTNPAPTPPAPPAVLSIVGSLKVPSASPALFTLGGPQVSDPTVTVAAPATLLGPYGAGQYAVVGPDGEYKITAYGVVGGKVQVAEATATIGAPSPTPTPNPVPPGPAPKPVWPSGTEPAARPLGTTAAPAEPRAVWASLPLSGHHKPKHPADPKFDKTCPCGEACDCRQRPNRKPESPKPVIEPRPVCEWRPIGPGVEAYCQLNPDGNWYYQQGNPAVLRYTPAFVPAVAAPVVVGPVPSCSRGGCR